jgi:hypothetical protein
MVAERYADGEVHRYDLAKARTKRSGLAWDLHQAVHACCGGQLEFGLRWVLERTTGPHAPGGENRFQPRCTVLRDIFGNPFHPVAFSPDWRTSTAVLLARQMYDSRDFSAMPILADALEDAGCDSAGLLTHCRDPQQPHARGCWVVDLLLAAE